MRFGGRVVKLAFISGKQENKCQILLKTTGIKTILGNREQRKHFAFIFVEQENKQIYFRGTREQIPLRGFCFVCLVADEDCTTNTASRKYSL